MASTDDWVWAAMEPELTEIEKELRIRFVDEYLVDYNVTLAASRVGFQFDFAKDYGAKFIRESFVQKLIKQKEHAKAVDPKAVEEYNKARVIATLVKVMEDGGAKHSARVSAAAQLKGIYGMDKPVVAKNEHTIKGGVLMVPAIANLDDWEAVAKAQQAKLVADVRS